MNEQSPDRQHYVYIHRRATDGTVFYVGKGKGRRAWGLQGRNPWWKHVADKHGYTVEILRGGMNAACALTMERIVIRKFGMANLTNLVDGGGGIPGWKHTDDARQKIGAASRARVMTPKAAMAIGDRSRGKQLSPEHVAKLSAAKRGKRRGPLPDDVKAKIAAAHVGMRASAEARQKMREAKVGQRKREDCNLFDPTIMVFEHPTHGQFVGCQYDLRVQFGIGAPCLTSIIKGRQKTAKGWRFICKKEAENV